MIVKLLTEHRLVRVNTCQIVGKSLAAAQFKSRIKLQVIESPDLNMHFRSFDKDLKQLYKQVFVQECA